MPTKEAGPFLGDGHSLGAAYESLRQEGKCERETGAVLRKWSPETAS